MNTLGKAEIVNGAKARRAFSRVSKKPYDKTLRNAEHYVAVPDGDGWLIEPLAWSLMAARGERHETLTRAKSPTVSDKRELLTAGFRQIRFGHSAFVQLWKALLDWCEDRGIAPPSDRADRSREEDRSFWVPITPQASVKLNAPKTEVEPAQVTPAKKFAADVIHPHQPLEFQPELESYVRAKETDETPISPEDYASPEYVGTEAAARQVTRNERERDRKARDFCIEIYRKKNHGRLRCNVCQLDFAEKYGAHGEGFMHVHHLDPIAEAEGPRLVHPEVDLVPVCPNCHAMIHRRKPALTIAELVSLIEPR